jgi:SRSO17 transposase
MESQWPEDPRRCNRAGIPEQDRPFRTKEELVLKIVDHAMENGLQFGWVGSERPEALDRPDPGSAG